MIEDSKMGLLRASKKMLGVYNVNVHNSMGGCIHHCQTEACIMCVCSLVVLVYTCMCRRFPCNVKF